MADGVPRIVDTSSDHVCVSCCMGKMREGSFCRNPEKTVKSAGALDIIHSDVMGSMQRNTTGGFLEKFKMFKADMENATGRNIKRIRANKGGEYTGQFFKEYLSKQGIRREKTVPIPNTVTVKTPYEIVYQNKPQLKNLKVFGALDYGHIADGKLCKLDAKAFKCRFLGYEDDVKRYRVLNVGTGQVKIVRTVKFMETTSTGDFMTEGEGDDKDGDEDVATPHAAAPSRGQPQTPTIFNDEVVPLQHEVTTVEKQDPRIRRSKLIGK
ncbi:hypothetical protein PR003_g10308 [Phytophthora rubi]|uniref:Retroviral polymerase SH3-like domain-containing protein n=1 Tax=Phytophthora rubi TaxID=129364 RepID=A0A6A4F600_9STRA|nr:hypothetical protein PR003_g10308 [Phytophthora rubi]